MAGTGELLAGAGNDPAELRRRVTSPGGLTERGPAALEAAGVRAAFDDAVDAVVGRVNVLPLAITRGDVADYVDTLITVYIVLIFIQILVSWFSSIPYHPLAERVPDVRRTT